MEGRWVCEFFVVSRGSASAHQRFEIPLGGWRRFIKRFTLKPQCIMHLGEYLCETARETRGSMQEYSEKSLAAARHPGHNKPQGRWAGEYESHEFFTNTHPIHPWNMKIYTSPNRARRQERARHEINKQSKKKPPPKLNATQPRCAKQTKTTKRNNK